ncbi:MAG: hypothetical protein KKH29_04330 [Candidatus Omnitrophica bacterium]|nr:hypothetical protein [Candidatus Omnitrophota bacterium]MBU4472717.1 hypothetical protein [Candidatus Omnitrophota bacterium]MCG2706398.1 hypothetical protein [Candidatus Omnitrophota bacterium]
MIEINLLPEELKLKRKKIGQEIKSRQILSLVPLLFVILLIIHAFLAGVLIVKNLELKILRDKWQVFTPQRQLVQDYKKKYEGFSENARLIQQLISRRVNWSRKLNSLSLNLPSGVWFNDISITPGEFIVRASVVSLQKEEMLLINKFIDSLKEDEVFFKDFNNLELTSAQRKIVSGYDIVDFILAGQIRQR